MQAIRAAGCVYCSTFELPSKKLPIDKCERVWRIRSSARSENVGGEGPTAQFFDDLVSCQFAQQIQCRFIFLRIAAGVRRKLRCACFKESTNHVGNLFA